MEELLLLLAYSSPSDVNYRHPSRNYCAALHYACTLGRQVVVQLLVWVSNNDFISNTKINVLFCYLRTVWC